jgi:hypothetical protein
MAEDLQLVVFAAVIAVFMFVACLATRRRVATPPTRQEIPDRGEHRQTAKGPEADIEGHSKAA